MNKIVKIINEEISKNIELVATDLMKTGNFTKLGSGQNGIALLNNETKQVHKLTNSPQEIRIIEKLKNYNYKTFPEIISINYFGDVMEWVRPYYQEISGELSEKIGEELNEIADFLDERKNWDSRKSNTNLVHYFDEKFLKFLNDLKKDLFKLGELPFKWDIDGLAINLFLNNNNYILADF